MILKSGLAGESRMNDGALKASLRVFFFFFCLFDFSTLMAPVCVSASYVV